MNTEKPTPPEGYEVIKGQHLHAPDYAFLKVWDTDNALGPAWREHRGADEIYRIECWYAVPVQKPASFDAGPSFPKGHLRAIGGQVPIPLPLDLMVWDEDIHQWLSTAYKPEVVPHFNLNRWHCWPGNMVDPDCKWCGGPCESHIGLGCKGPPGDAGAPLGTDPKKSQGDKKPQLQLIPPALNDETAKALARGAEKYGVFNWRKNNVEVMTYLGAMKRHIDKFLNGEDIDPDTGAHHLGCVAAGCGIVLDARQYGTLVDNRPPPMQTA